MRATRATQPYRSKRGRQPGSALLAMLRGSPFFMANPVEVRRAVQRQARPKRARARRSSTLRSSLPR